MNSGAAILNKIFALTRGDLENATAPWPDPGRIFHEYSLVRLSRLAAFWRGPGTVPDALMQSTACMLAGIHAQHAPVAFVFIGQDRDIGLWAGTSVRVMSKMDVGSLLHGVFPDCRTDEKSAFPARHPQFTHAMLLTGTPTLPDAAPGLRDQIEYLIRGLQGRHWMFLIDAHPISAPDVVRALNETADEITAVRNTFMLRQSPADEQNRLAERYVRLLDARLKRLEAGRIRGMWLANRIFFAEDISTLGLARGLLHSAFSGDQSLPDPIRLVECSPACTQAPVQEPITTMELAAFTSPPREEYPGLEIVEQFRYGLQGPPVTGPRTVTLGDIMDRGKPTRNTLLLSEEALTRHGLVAGITGSGKTNTCIALLQQLWRERIPFMVIESAKSEYRELIHSVGAKHLRVFTIGNEPALPLRINPFEVPAGVLVQGHIDYLNSLFSAAYVLYPPMPYVLEQSIQECYVDKGWDLAENVNRRGQSRRAFPTLTDLAAKISAVVERMGYDERITMDVRAGLLARVDNLRAGGKGMMFDVLRSTPAEFLFHSPCILELKDLVNDDEKAFLMGLLLIRLYEIAEADPARRDGALHHVTLIEEAHRLLKNTTTAQGGDAANPRGRAIEVFANILSEVRAYGEGFLIAEQVPTKLATDAIKNTSLKIVHKLLAEDDRQLMGKSMNLDELQIKGLGLLAAGEAVASTERMFKPVLVRMPHAKERLSRVSQQELVAAVRPFQSDALAGCRYCLRAGPRVPS